MSLPDLPKGTTRADLDTARITMRRTADEAIGKGVSIKDARKALLHTAGIFKGRFGAVYLYAAHEIMTERGWHEGKDQAPAPAQLSLF